MVVDDEPMDEQKSNVKAKSKVKAAAASASKPKAPPASVPKMVERKKKEDRTAFYVPTECTEEVRS